MNTTILLNAEAKATLTTESPGPNFGIKVLRLELASGVGSLDLGPADELPSGVTAAALVKCVAWAMDDETREAARAFCAQWPAGPQIA